MKLGSFKLINYLAVLPVAVLVATSIASIANVLTTGSEPNTLVLPFLMLAMIGYYAVPTIGIPYILFWATTIAAGWRTTELTVKHRIFLTIYSLTTICFMAYIIWWYATSQKFTYL
jgi:hypothetical protein